MIDKRIGLVGLGGMGRGLAKNLLLNGAELMVSDLDPTKVSTAVSQGATAVADPIAMARQADILIICITTAFLWCAGAWMILPVSIPRFDQMAMSYPDIEVLFDGAWTRERDGDEHPLIRRRGDRDRAHAPRLRFRTSAWRPTRSPRTALCPRALPPRWRRA